MNQDAIRKAAILIAVADHETADALLDRLDPEQAAAVRKCAVQLQQIDTAEREDIFSEFTETHIGTPPNVAAAYTATSQTIPRQPKSHLVPSQEPAGIDLGATAVSHLRIPGEVLGGSDASYSDVARSPRKFDSLQGTDPSELARFLAKENPQAIAVVFSLLAPTQASGVLRELPARLRADVLERLTQLEETDDDVIHDVELGLQQWLSEQEKRVKRRRAGISSVARILDAADEDLRQEMLSDLGKRNSKLAEQMKHLGVGASTPTQERTVPTNPRSIAEIEPMSLEQITRLRTATLVKVLDACDRETLVLAMAGAEPEVVSNLLSVLGLADGREIREAISQLGPVRLSDVDACQKRLGQLAAEYTQPVANMQASYQAHARVA